MSTRLPWLKLYPADFVNHTVGLTKRELGIYVTLLMYSWTSGAIPNDPTVLKSIVGAGFEGVVARFFKATPDGLIAPFLEQSREEVTGYLDKKRESAKKGGKVSAAKRKQRSSIASSTSSTAQATLNPSTSTATSTTASTPTPSTATASPRASASPTASTTAASTAPSTRSRTGMPFNGRVNI
jgi:uncharacterized protein YdaU (DUF1376 family)